jgi:hypothetical protein
MIKITSTARDAGRLSHIKPLAASGNFTIDFTDPITGKVRKRIEEKNHVFTESLMHGTGNWITKISGQTLVINDSDRVVDTTLPYIHGDTVAYGIPSQGSLGTTRGAYNAANQVLAEWTLEKIRWKFQYDFTTAQANGLPMKNIGLTSQYVMSLDRATAHGDLFLSSFKRKTCDGRYAYEISTAGIITIYDLFVGGATAGTIDISAVTGTASNEYKAVGYDAVTGKYYVWRGSSTAGNRKLYKFSDNSFLTLETTYSPSNMTLNASFYPTLYIRGDVMYFPYSNNIYYSNYVANDAYTTLNMSTYIPTNIVMVNEVSATYSAAAQNLDSGSLMSGKYLVSYAGSTYSTYGRKCFILDLETLEVIAVMAPLQTQNTIYDTIQHPLTNEKLFVNLFYKTHNAAIAAKVLGTPVTKTSANGMTVTYEVEVYW